MFGLFLFLPGMGLGGLVWLIYESLTCWLEGPKDSGLGSVQKAERPGGSRPRLAQDYVTEESCRPHGVGKVDWLCRFGIYYPVTGMVHIALGPGLRGEGGPGGGPSALFLMCAPRRASAMFFSHSDAAPAVPRLTRNRLGHGGRDTLDHPPCVIPHCWEIWNDCSISYGQA